MESRQRIHQHGEPGDERDQETLVREIAALWAEFLNGGVVSADDDFFALGGNSMIGIRIIERVSRDYGVQLSVRDFYLAQTPAQVAELIERGRTPA
jgi:acyl carrier protein